MATAYNATQYGSDVPKIGVGDFGNLKVVYGSFEASTALVINDTINIATMPKGFTPMFGWMVGDDIDTGTETLELDVGISGDTTKYLNSGVVTGDTISELKTLASIYFPLGEDLFTVKPTKLTADTDIIVKVTAAPAAGGTGTLTVFMCGVYNDARVDL
jgi:hypothetical protein